MCKNVTLNMEDPSSVKNLTAVLRQKIESAGLYQNMNESDWQYMRLKLMSLSMRTVDTRFGGDHTMASKYNIA